MPKATLVGTQAVTKPYPDHSACAGTNAGLERRLRRTLVFASIEARGDRGPLVVVYVGAEHP